jgi:hypothetical protein
MERCRADAIVAHIGVDFWRGVAMGQDKFPLIDGEER